MKRTVAAAVCLAIIPFTAHADHCDWLREENTQAMLGTYKPCPFGMSVNTFAAQVMAAQERHRRAWNRYKSCGDEDDARHDRERERERQQSAPSTSLTDSTRNPSVGSRFISALVFHLISLEVKQFSPYFSDNLWQQASFSKKSVALQRQAS